MFHGVLSNFSHMIALFAVSVHSIDIQDWTSIGIIRNASSYAEVIVYVVNTYSVVVQSYFVDIGIGTILV